MRRHLSLRVRLLANWAETNRLEVGGRAPVLQTPPVPLLQMAARLNKPQEAAPTRGVHLMRDDHLVRFRLRRRLSRERPRPPEIFPSQRILRRTMPRNPKPSQTKAIRCRARNARRRPYRLRFLRINPPKEPKQSSPLIRVLLLWRLIRH